MAKKDLTGVSKFTAQLATQGILDLGQQSGAWPTLCSTKYSIRRAVGQKKKLQYSHPPIQQLSGIIKMIASFDCLQ